MLERTPGNNFRELDEIMLKTAARDILSHTTRRFNLPVKRLRPQPADVLAARPGVS